jgi:hypothetical protein
MSKFQDSGALFPTKKKVGSNQPDYDGTVEISPELLVHLNQLHQAGKEIKFRLAGWAKRSKADNKFIGLKVSVIEKKRSREDALADALLSTQEKKSPELDDDIPF